MDETRRSLILGGLAFGLSPGIGWANASAVGGHAFGGTWRLVSGGLADVAARVQGHIAGIDATMSPYRMGSLLSQFNRAPPGRQVDLPADMAQVVRAALDMSAATRGAFDPTVGPIVHRYGFGPIAGVQAPLDASQAIALRGTSLSKTVAEVTLDLCGIAKGYALDAIASDLTRQGAGDFLLEIGGEVRAVGRHPSGRSWQVAIEDPTVPGFAAFCIVAPGAMALATSGHRANGHLGPVALSHIIDPRTHRPAIASVAAVSVLSETAMEADALATALLAMGDDGPGFATRQGISALFIMGAGQAPRMTGAFADHVLA